MADPLILGSSSIYRAQALESLGLSFTQVAPRVDETPRQYESPKDLAARLAHAKATDVAQQHLGAIVIGSDQVGFCAGELLSKPGTKANAIETLRRNSGKTAIFFTALVCAKKNSGGELQSSLDICKTELKVHDLTVEQIIGYVERDNPINTAGAFKAESLGIALFKYIRADDPSALIGLPLIALTRRLQAFGIDPLAPPD